jgi:hypothetical protein
MVTKERQSLKKWSLPGHQRKIEVRMLEMFAWDVIYN